MSLTLSNVAFNLREPMAEQDDILRCLNTLLMTPAGTVPLDRDFGIDNSLLGYPMDVAQSLLAIEIIDKVTRYEPRASVLEVELEPNAEGQITAKVVITNA